MYRFKTAGVLLLFLLVIVATAFAAIKYYGNESASRKILIASEPTRYKNRMIKELIEKLDDGDTYIVEVDHKRGDLEGMDPRDYTAVFISNSGAQARVRPAVMQWLNSVRDYDDNVIVHTTQTTDWDPPIEVDSITSASKNSNIDDLTDDVVRRLRAFY
jgi:hypothetical protein